MDNYIFKIQLVPMNIDVLCVIEMFVLFINN